MTPARVVRRNSSSLLTASQSAAKDGETRSASSKTSRGNGVGSSDIGACVKLAHIACPDSSESNPTSSPCCAAHDTASSRMDRIVSSLRSAGAPDARAVSAIARTVGAADLRRPRGRGRELGRGDAPGKVDAAALDIDEPARPRVDRRGEGGCDGRREPLFTSCCFFHKSMDNKIANRTGNGPQLSTSSSSRPSA